MPHPRMFPGEAQNSELENRITAQRGSDRSDRYLVSECCSHAAFLLPSALSSSLHFVPFPSLCVIQLPGRKKWILICKRDGKERKDIFNKVTDNRNSHSDMEDAN